MTHFSRLYPTPDDQPIHRPGAALSPSERRAILQDRNWFRSNPDRTIRLRDPAPGEAAAIAAAAGMPLPDVADAAPLRIVVSRIGPGLRERRPIWTHVGPDAPEPVIRALVRLIDKSIDEGFNGLVTREELGLALGLEPPPLRH